MRDPTAQTEPLTEGQKIVAAYEADTIAEPCELAAAIDKAIAAEREANAQCAEHWGLGPTHMDRKATAEMIAKMIRRGS